MSQQRAAAASAVGGKTARACDSCLRRRARWYRAADDAFLCQACDYSVHSANPLASRHERVRLKTSSTAAAVFLSALVKNKDNKSTTTPSWLHGFKRKARTPRGKPSNKYNSSSPSSNPAPKSSESLVPDLEGALAEEVDSGSEEEQQQFLYRVPVFDPILEEFCSPPLPLDVDDQAKPMVDCRTSSFRSSDSCDDDRTGMTTAAGVLQPEKELAEFAADMETLLGHGLDDYPFSMEDLGLGCGEGNGSCVKTKTSTDINSNTEIKMGFHCSVISKWTSKRVDEDNSGAGNRKLASVAGAASVENYVEQLGAATEVMVQTGVMLKLDYEAVVEAWSSGGCTSPWTDGERPQLNLAGCCWPEFMGMWGGGDVQGMYGEAAMTGAHDGSTVAGGDSGREARVTRYREKRRTRLFFKKIRYEVRKLNAEKRPRMKGRFIKRTAFIPAIAGGTVAFRLTKF